MENEPAESLEETNANRNGKKFLIACQLISDEPDEHLSGFRAELWQGEERSGAAASDDFGRIVIIGDRLDPKIDLMLVVLWPLGARLASYRLDAETTSRSDITLQVPGRPGPNRTWRSRSYREPATEPDAIHRFYAATAAALSNGSLSSPHGILSAAAWIHPVLDDLDDLVALSKGVIEGKPRSVDGLRELVRGAPTWAPGIAPEDLPTGDGVKLGCFARPPDPRVLLAAGALLDQLVPNQEVGPWGPKILGFYLFASSRVNSALSAADELLNGQRSLESFSETLARVTSTVHMGSGGTAPSIDHRHMPEREPEDASGGHEEHLAMIMPRRTLDWADLDPCGVALGRCAGRIAPSIAANLTTNNVPTIIGRVEPDTVCIGYTGTFVLYPRVGEQFPPQPTSAWRPHEGLTLLLNWVPYQLEPIPSGWHTDYIEVTVKWGLLTRFTSGCGMLIWQPSLDTLGGGSVGDFERDDCLNLLGIEPAEIGRLASLGMPEPLLPTIAFLDAQAKTLNANGQSGDLAVEASDAVNIEWEAFTGQCTGRFTVQAGPAVSVIVRLLANGTPLVVRTPLKGKHIDTGIFDVTYTLEIETQISGAVCGQDSRSLMLTRIRRLKATIDDRIFRPGGSVPFTIGLNCPAPPGGLQVTIAASEPVIGGNVSGQVLIPAGSRDLTIPLTAPNSFPTTVNLNIQAAGFLPAFTLFRVNPTSCLPSSFVPDARRYGGAWQVIATTPPLASIRAFGVHLAVLHTGKVLLFSYDEGSSATHAPGVSDPADVLATAYSISRSDRAKSALWDPTTNAVTEIPLERNLFCSGHAFLPDGRLFIVAGQFSVPFYWWAPIAAGGLGAPPPIDPVTLLALGLVAQDPGAARDLNIFDPATESWTRISPDIAAGRWYPSVATLPDGQVLAISGTDSEFGGDAGIQNSLQIFNPMASATPPFSQRQPVEPLGSITGPLYHLYPFTHVLPDGTVFIHWKRMSWLYNPVAKTWEQTGWPLFGPTTGTRHPFSRTGPGPGTSVLLPLRPFRNLTATSISWDYPRGKIMIVGGGGAEGKTSASFPDEPPPGAPEVLTRTTPATNTSEILDLDDHSSGFPAQWRFTGKDQNNPSFMTLPRVMPDAVLLPDGKVLVVNGASVGRSGGFLIHFGASWGATSPATAPEVFDPETETWDILCPMNLTRLYHATAALLPDGRVVVAGHDGFLNAPPFTTTEYRLEVFSPPYLFRGPRPGIQATASRWYYRLYHFVETTDADTINSVVLIRQSSVTHQTNTDQRYVGLHFDIETQQGKKGLSVLAPPNGGVAPPGYYMLFIVNHAGVPSVASWVRLG